MAVRQQLRKKKTTRHREVNNSGWLKGSDVGSMFADEDGVLKKKKKKRD